MSCAIQSLKLIINYLLITITQAVHDILQLFIKELITPNHRCNRLLHCHKIKGCMRTLTIFSFGIYLV